MALFLLICDVAFTAGAHVPIICMVYEVQVPTAEFVLRRDDGIWKALPLAHDNRLIL